MIEGSNREDGIRLTSQVMTTVLQEMGHGDGKGGEDKDRVGDNEGSGTVEAYRDNTQSII